MGSVGVFVCFFFLGLGSGGGGDGVFVVSWAEVMDFVLFLFRSEGGDFASMIAKKETSVPRNRYAGLCIRIFQIQSKSQISRFIEQLGQRSAKK